MPLDVKRLRRWFAAAAILLAVIVAATYFYARYRVRNALRDVPQQLAKGVQQSTEGFTLSKSEGGHTLFTVHAANAVQYKQAGHAELHDVSIVVYGREADRFDQIYGADFEYDPQSGEISARGEVLIDLQANSQGPARPDQATPAEVKNPIRLKTSGLNFNQKTGVAATHEKIEFRIPQASGWAVGASYNARNNTLTLDHDVHVQTGQGATLLARHGVVTHDPRQAVLTAVSLERPNGEMHADKLTLFLRDDNTVARMLASGDVRSSTRGASPVNVHAPQAEFFMGNKDQLRSAMLSGGISFEQGGASPVRGTAGTATLEFGPRNALARVLTSAGVKFTQAQKATSAQPAQDIDLDTAGTSLWFDRGRPQRAETSGPAQITIRPQAPATGQAQTLVTAARFDVSFDPRTGRMANLRGAPDARIVSTVPGQPPRTSSSQELEVAFSPQAGGITGVSQKGKVQYEDAERNAWADQAHYTPDSGEVVMSGSPRFVSAGLTTTARTLRLNQKSGEVAAQGDVKTTYNELKPQPAGAMLATADPVHVTAGSMQAARATGVARYKGSARLWQGANVVEAPSITFDRAQRSLVAQGSGAQRVATVFVQVDKSGRVVPVSVTASRLAYSDPQRMAKFDGEVVLKEADTTMTAQEATVKLLPAGSKSGASAPDTASKLDQILAEGGVTILEPTRKAAGQKLVYTASDGKFVLTGGPCSIFNAEHGSISGDSLTFFSRDDRVLVGSANSSRTVTKTRVVK
jgi:lipopolysaccharide export system protein LptA